MNKVKLVSILFFTLLISSFAYADIKIEIGNGYGEAKATVMVDGDVGNIQKSADNPAKNTFEVTGSDGSTPTATCRNKRVKIVEEENKEGKVIKVIITFFTDDDGKLVKPPS